MEDTHSSFLEEQPVGERREKESSSSSEPLESLCEQCKAQIRRMFCQSLTAPWCDKTSEALLRFSKKYTCPTGLLTQNALRMSSNAITINIVELNVGGVFYSTSRGTLTCVSGSKLARMFADEDTVLKDSKVVIFSNNFACIGKRRWFVSFS